jgi:hypothetical protein
MVGFAWLRLDKTALHGDGEVVDNIEISSEASDGGVRTEELEAF